MSTGEHEELEDNSLQIKLVKGLGLAGIFIVCLIFGIIPKKFEIFRKNPMMISLTNAFSGGLFLGIGLLHLLPDANHLINHYYEDKNKKKPRHANHYDPNAPPFPFAFITVFVIYGVMLFIEKVAFPDIEEEKASSIYQEENEEEVKKNIKDLGQMLNEEGEEKPNEENEEENEENESKKEKGSKKEKFKMSLEVSNADKGTGKNKLNSYILMVALSFHGAFECLALGIQNDLNAAIILVIALLIHKWAEALTVGIAFIRGGLSNLAFYILMVIFCLIGPIGGIVGALLATNVNYLVQGILIAVSVGTFLYISCSEVISEEFASKDYKYAKYFLFIFGGFCAFALNLFEYLTAQPEEQKPQ